MAGFWRKCRIGFRWFRITVWFIVLVAVCVFAWFNQVGLPEFLKARLVNALHERGVELQFSRLRLRIVHGLVAEKVHVSQAHVNDGPEFSAGDVQVRLNFMDLLHRHVQVDGLVLNDSVFTWPITTNFTATATNLQLELHFHSNDTWTLDHCFATVDGTRIAITAEIAHAPELRNWEWFRSRPTGSSRALLGQVEKITDILNQINLPGTPVLKLSVNGDARDASTFDLHLTASVPAANTPWGRFRNTDLVADARLVRPDCWPRLDLHLNASEAYTPWGSLNQGNLSLQTEAAPAPQLPPLTLHLETGRLNTRFCRTRNFQLDAQVTTNSIVLNPDLNTAWWTNLQPYRLTWQTRLDELFAANLNADDIVCAGSWQYPNLTVSHITGRLAGGDLSTSAALNISTRLLVFTNDSHIDLNAISGLLPPAARTRLNQITWNQPPWVHGDGQLTLPPWTDHAFDWRTDIGPSLQLNGDLAFTNALVAGLSLDLVRTHFSYSNQVWQLPSLHLSSARSHLDLNVSEDDTTKEFSCAVQGRFDPVLLLPFFPQTNAAQAFQICEFTEPPAFSARLAGRWNDWSSLTATGSLALTNFAVRGQWVDNVTSTFDYTNLAIRFHNPRLWRANGAQTMTADLVMMDFRALDLRFTNGFSTTEPMMLARAIGPTTAEIVEPYQFLSPPTARINGRLGLRIKNGGHNLDDVDLTFDILRPAPFRWSKIQSPQVTGTIHWLGPVLVLTNIAGSFYNGDGNGWAYFDFRVPHPGADYQFSFAVHNANLHLLANDVISATNQLEGKLTGEINITQASTESIQSWFGFGHAQLTNGLIWDFPVFGILSPVLNTISPGLGNNRATEATASFFITNGVYATDSLMIRSAMSRLEYKGTIDSNQRVNAIVTLELLRNAPVVGVVISTVLRPVSKVFAYHVSGPLDNPRTVPVYVPEIFLLPFHPFRTMEDIFTPTSTNAPVH